jgi:tetratricopeptide (TPR) repeat protein
MPDLDLNKSVFISYRRSVSRYIARAIFEHLRNHRYDVFLDVENIDSGDWATIILNQIAARAHFLIILTPGTLDRCSEPKDMVRREIERAIELKRNIIPILIDEYDFDAARPHMIGKLSGLDQYNALRLPYDFFDESMERLRSRFLKPPAALPIIQPTPPIEEPQVEQIIESAANEPEPTKAELAAEHLFTQAWFQMEAGFLDSAIASYTEAIELNSDYVFAYNNRGIARGMKGDLEGAIRDFDTVISRKPDDAEAYNNRGAAYTEKGDLDRAIHNFDTAIKLKSDHAEAYYNRGVAYDKKGNWYGSITSYNNAIQFKADYSEAYNNQAEAYFVLRQYARALASFQKAHELDPDNPMIVGGLAITQYELGHKEAARQLWRSLAEQDSSYKNAEWVRDEMNWAEPLVEAARKLISELD